MRLTPALGAALLLLGGCGATSEPGVYALPVHEVYERLAKADLNGFRMARQCGILIYFTPHMHQDESVGWTVTSGGRDLVTFTVHLAPADGGTRTWIEVSRDPKGGELYDGKKFYVRPALHQPLRPAVRELIDAAIEKRPYDVWKIPQPINTDDGVCSIQRGSLEMGHGPFHVDDKAGDPPGFHKPAGDWGPDVTIDPASGADGEQRW